MNIAYYLILTLHVAACLFLIGVVLLQQGKSQDLASAFGGGGTQAAFGPRGSATILSRATTVLAVVFMITCLALTMIHPRSTSILDQVPAGQAAPPSQSAPSSGAQSAAPAAAPASSVPAPAANPASSSAPASQK